VFLAHATGFCKEVWDPVVAELRAAAWGGSITAWDAPGHGGSRAAGVPFDWWDTAHAALYVIAACESAGPRLGVGHSMGGATLVMAELLAPGTVQGLILIEPIMFPPPFQRVEDNPLAVGATRRRASFASRQEALENFSLKDAFTSWDERALQAYVDGGLVERGGRFWLACDPDLEADAYRSGTAHGAYARLSEIACPVLIVAGASSETHAEAFVEHLAGLLPNGRYRLIPGTGHFLPMERPDLIAGQIADEFSRLTAD
jgi:pimeloyl-ACP methyl ester carboxylesterase